MSQLEFFTRPEMWRQTAKLEYWAGYSWTEPLDLAPYIRGRVATPRWARRVKGLLMLDNGAWPAFRDGVDLSFGDQVDAMRPFLARAAWVIAPDIVAGAMASWARTMEAVRIWPEHHGRLLLPLQDGIATELVVETAQRFGCGIFVGGRTHEWKIGVAKLIHALGFEGRIHVGRVAHPQHLAPLTGVATSIDNTSWVRAQHYNRRLPLPDLLSAFVAPANDSERVAS